jgi:hypothetical protein
MILRWYWVILRWYWDEIEVVQAMFNFQSISIS